MARSIGLGLYLMVSNHLSGYANRKLKRRLAEGKEHPDRIDERRGIASQPRPAGQLIWFHAASVGESLSLLDLITRLRDDDPGLNILITTGTQTSAELLSKRLPDGVIHQFVPVDARPFVRKFLDHWHPDIAVWTESELWPALIHETHARGTSMVLLNARISEKSLSSWKWARGMIKGLLGRFHLILAQDIQSNARLLKLGADPDRTSVNGSLKQSGGALPHNEIDRTTLAESLGSRPVWLAASTHPGEEELASQAHRIARGSAHKLMLIIAPRHPDRGPDIASMLRDEGWTVGLRSDGDEPDADTDIYVADTLGEMGLWYRLAPVSFLGGSLVEIGGHNPFEPAALGSAILHGPYVESAQEIYDMLTTAKAAREVNSPESLAHEVIDLLEPQNAAAMAHAAWEISSSGAEATENALAALQNLLDERLA